MHSRVLIKLPGHMLQVTILSRSCVQSWLPHLH